MVVGEIPEPADLLVVGAGPAGYAGAIRAAQLGRRVVLVERGGTERVGGDCLHATCVPSKALIDVADVVHRAGSWRPAGVTGAVGFDMPAWQRWRERLVGEIRDDVDGVLRAAGVSVLSGEVHFTRADQAVVADPSGTTRYYQFTDVLIATGSRTAPPRGLQPDGRRIFDAAGLLASQEVPERLAVVGGGATGVEMATAFAKLGSVVTVIEQGPRPLADIDERLVAAVTRRWRSLGVQLLAGATAVGDDGRSVTVDVAGVSRSVTADLVLVATGRSPNTDALGLDRLGITPDRDGAIAVGDDQRVRPHVAAAGDVTPGVRLEHTASAEAVVAAESLSGQRVAYQPQAVPMVVFADPTLATVGLTAAQARAQGADVVEVEVPLAATEQRPVPDRDSRRAFGMVRLVSDAADGRVLGVHLAGAQAAEHAGAAVTLLEFGGTVDDLARIVMPHRAWSEALVESARLTLGSPLSAATAVWFDPGRPR